MRRLLVPVLALLMGCAEVPPPRVSPSEPMQIRSDTGWVSDGRSPSVEVPRGWYIDDEPRDIFKGMTTVLIAQTPRPVGDIRISLTVSMRPWDRGSELFAAAVPLGLMRKGLDIREQRAIWVGGEPASRTLAVDEGNLITQINIAVDGIAYIVLCTGSDTPEVRSTCKRLLDSVELESTLSVRAMD